MITFIVPAFNELGNITPTINTIRQVAAQSALDGFEIIVVDDGSTDGSAEEIAQLVAAYDEVTSISNASNIGLGSSIRAGIKAASSPRFMVVPGDDDVSIELLTMLLMYRDEADVILTAPLNKEQRPLGRNIISMFYQMAYMTSFRIYVSYINGPGIWPVDAALDGGLRAQRFSIISELNVKVLRMGGTFAEVPGYFQAGPKARRTVTFRNLMEVIRSFVMLNIDVHVVSRSKYHGRPKRNQIDFTRAPTSGPNPASLGS